MICDQIYRPKFCPRTFSTSTSGRTRASIHSPIGPRPPLRLQLRHRRKLRVQQPPHLIRRLKPSKQKSPCVTMVSSRRWWLLREQSLQLLPKHRHSQDLLSLRKSSPRRQPHDITSRIGVTVQRRLIRSVDKAVQRRVLVQTCRRFLLSSILIWRRKTKLRSRLSDVFHPIID